MRGRRKGAGCKETHDMMCLAAVCLSVEPANRFVFFPSQDDGSGGSRYFVVENAGGNPETGIGKPVLRGEVAAELECLGPHEIANPGAYRCLLSDSSSAKKTLNSHIFL